MGIGKIFVSAWMVGFNDRLAMGSKGIVNPMEIVFQDSHGPPVGNNVMDVKCINVPVCAYFDQERFE